MPIFQLDDITLDIPHKALGTRVQRALEVGTFERDEAQALPRMVDVSKANLRRNGVRGAEILWGAAVPSGEAAGTVAFSERRQFWASSVVSPMADALPRGVHSWTYPLCRLMRCCTGPVRHCCLAISKAVNWPCSRWSCRRPCG